jgi:hypothetical protein
MLIGENKFRFDIPVDTFFKAGPDGQSRKIGGICTTDQIDRQMETILQSGLDFGPFLSDGWFNDNHSSDTDGVVGYPTKAEKRELSKGRTGWYVEGYLLPANPDSKGETRADRIWNLAQSLQKTDRRLGFSVEGSILERDPDDPTKIKRAVVTEVAITKCPVNTGTALAVLAKSLSAGGAVANPGTSPGQGFPLRTESLEGVASAAWERGKKRKKKKRRKLRKSEAVLLLRRLRPDLPSGGAELIVNYALRHYPAA